MAVIARRTSAILRHKRQRQCQSQRQHRHQYKLPENRRKHFWFKENKLSAIIIASKRHFY